VRRYLPVAVRYGEAFPQLPEAARVLGREYADAVFSKGVAGEIAYRSPRPGEFDIAQECWPPRELARLALAYFARFVENLTRPCPCGEPAVASFAPVVRTRTGQMYLGWMSTACAAQECQRRARTAAEDWARGFAVEPEHPGAQVTVEDLLAGEAVTAPR